MGHNHAHDHHGHAAHAHAPRGFGRAFAFGAAFNLAFVAIEAGYGWWANSLALLSDAGHNLSDVLGLLLAWAATVAVQRLPSKRHTYGLRRSSILAALLNAMLLLLAVGAIAWEAIGRFRQPQAVATDVVMIVAAIGIVVNGASAWLFASGARQDINLRGAFLHMLADAAVSLGVVLAALAIRHTGWLWLDPATSLAVALVITLGTWSLLRDSLRMALDAVPAHIDTQDVENYLAGLPGVRAVHDLHIWGLSTTEIALTAHLVKPDATLDDALLARIRRELHERFGIEHITIQFELGDAAHPCAQEPASAL